MRCAAYHRFWSLIPCMSFLVILSFCQKVKAQTPEELELQGDYRGTSHHYVASKKIHAKSVFQFTADSDNTFVARLGEREVLENFGGIINAPDPSNPPAEQGSPGATVTNYQVNSSGAFIYDIPIIVTPGTNGMTPQMSIAYSSSGGDGILGMGFNLSGLSSISRGASTILHDNVADPVDFDDNDKLLLDGERLVEVANGTYGQHGAEYRVENNRMAKIIQYQGINATDSWFKVYERSGLIKYYGAPKTGVSDEYRVGASGATHTWLLSRVEDRSGNFISINYDRTDGQFLPLKVSYTGNDNVSPSQTPYASIEFTYEDRPEGTISFFVMGHESKINKRLIGITNKFGSTINREYELKYATLSPSYDYRSHLASITEYGLHGKAGGSLNFTPITFDWTTENLGYDEPDDDQIDIHSIVMTAPDPTLANPQPWSIRKEFVGDFLGNGQAQLLLVETYDVDFDIIVPETGEKTGIFELPTEIRTSIYQFNGAALELYASQVSQEAGVNFFVGDFTGDGRSNILKVYPDEDFKVLELDNAAITTAFTGTLPANDGIDIGDFDGDGLIDLTLYTNGAVSGRELNFYRNTGTNFQKLGGTTPNFNQGHLIADFNGDGASDIYYRVFGASYVLIMDKSDFGTWKEELLHGQLGYSWPDLSDSKVANKTIFGDFNGDGVLDIMVADFDADWTENLVEFPIYLGNGDGFTAKEMQIGVNMSFFFGTIPYDYKVHAADINGDGKTDMIAKFEDPDKTAVPFLNRGNSFEWVDTFTSSEEEMISADFNGNGITDFISISASTPTITQPVGYQIDFTVDIDIAFDYRKQPLLVEKVTNSLYSPVLIEYLPLTNEEVYTRYNNATGDLIDVNVPMYVTADVYTDDGIGGVSQTSYAYEGAKVHTKGRGFLGFEKVISENHRNGLKTTKVFRWDNPEYVTLLKSTSTTSTITDKVLSDRSIEFVDVNDLLTDTYLFLPDEDISRTFDPNTGALLSQVTTNYQTYDQWGNLTSQLQSHLSGHQTQTTHTYFTANTADWIIDRLETVQVTNQLPSGESTSRNMSFTYYTNGYLEKETIQPGNSLALETKYEYDTYGNIRKSTRTGSGESRIDEMLFSKTFHGRFPTLSTDAIGHQSAYNYDPIQGTLKLSEDPNGIQTSYGYDAFGRMTQITMPEGVTSTTYHWADNASPSHSALFTTTSTDGAGTIRTYYDRLNRPIREGEIARNGNYVYVDTQYNRRGLMGRSSLPFYEGTSISWSTYSYDAVGRLVELIEPGGRRSTNTYTGLKTTSINPERQSSEQTLNDLGQLVRSQDNMGTALVYQYHPNGHTKSIQVEGNASTKITMGYDLIGNQTHMDDPDLGRLDFGYNAFGELSSYSNGKGIPTTYTYDKLGRMKVRNINSGEHQTTWIYDTRWTGGLSTSTVQSNIGTMTQEYHYHSTFGVIERIEETLPGRSTYTSQMTYDGYGRLQLRTYPSGFQVKHHYNTNNGSMDRVSNAADSYTYWEATSENARGQLTEYLQGGILSSTMDYNSATGYLESIKTTHGSTIKHHMSFQFDLIGNLSSRTDHRVPGKLTETFGYDGLNRLTSTEIVNKPYGSLNMTYDALGNLTYKSDIGTYTYDGSTNGGPHALSHIDPSTAVGTSRLRKFDQDITYSAFDKVASIIDEVTSSETRELSFSYGADLQRRITTEKLNNTVTQTKYFIGGLYEEEVPGDGSDERRLHYINTGEGVTAIHTEEGNTGTTHYLLKDHLGSIAAIADEVGNIVERYSYDAWGNRRDPDTWELVDLDDSETYDRGFTGHEHLDRLGLINMNGRVYDPILGRFLSADPFIQFPEYTQGLNRYTYVLNNPISYTDPSGYFVNFIYGALGSAAVGYIIGSVVDHFIPGDNFNGGRIGFLIGLGLYLGYVGVNSLIPHNLSLGTVNIPFLGFRVSLTKSLEQLLTNNINVASNNFDPGNLPSRSRTRRLPPNGLPSLGFNWLWSNSIDNRLLLGRPIKIDLPVPKPPHELTWKDYLKYLDSIYHFRAKLNSGLNVVSTGGAAFINGYSAWLWRYWKIGNITDARSRKFDEGFDLQKGKIMQETPDPETARKLIKDELEIIKKATSTAGPWGEVFEGLMNEALEEDPFRNPERARKKALDKLKEKVGVDKFEKIMEQFSKE